MTKRFVWMCGAILCLSWAATKPALGYVEFNSGNYEPVDYLIGDTIAIDSALAPNPGTHVDLLAGGCVDGAVYAYNQGRFTLNGGTVNGRLNLHDHGAAEIKGGHVAYGDGNLFFGYENSTLTFYGSAFTVDGQPVTPGVSLKEHAVYNGTFYRGELVGMLADGSTICGDFFIYANADMTVVPEPSALVLLACGMAAFRRGRRRHAAD